MTRFNVSDQFAGKQGPCPKCKKTIAIPEKDESVVVHAPKHSGPSDSAGRPVLKPIKRSETKLTSTQIAIIACTIIGFLLAAMMMRMMVEDKTEFPAWILRAGSILIAFPVVYGAYTFLRDQELGGFLGRDLWIRIPACSTVYALLWFAFWIANLAFPGNVTLTCGTGVGAMIAIGAAAAMLLLDLDYLMGIVHFGLYLGVCVLARVILGIGALPGMLNSAPATPEVDPGALPVSMLEPITVFGTNLIGTLSGNLFSEILF